MGNVKRILQILLIISVAVTVLIGLPCRSFAASSNPLTIYTVNYPLAYFAERIGGDSVEVVFPAPADVDPAFWMPDKETVKRYQQADLILLNGAHYAKWVDKVSLPRAKTVNTSKKFKDKYITLQDTVTHSHGADGEHAHEDAAFTLWLDFELAALQARAIEKALRRKLPGQSDQFKMNLEALEKDLTALDQQLMKIVAADKKKPLLASHPVYDYLQRRYSLNLKSLHWEPDLIPGIAEWQNLQKILKNHPAEWMIWEGQPLPTSVDKLEKMGIGSIVFDPCMNRPESGDFISVMRKNIKNMQSMFIDY